MDSPEWHKVGDDTKDCSWVAKWRPRCSVRGYNGTSEEKMTAEEACPLACTDQLGCPAPSTENFVWVEESACATVHGREMNARSLLTAATR